MNCHNLFRRRIGALIVLSSVSAVMLAASCGGDEDAKVRTGAPEEEVKPVDSRPARTADDGTIRSESQALHALITVNEAEVQLGTLAQSKASAEDVKDYATQMAAAHRAAIERLAALAQQKGITPEANPVSDALKSVADTIRARLEGLSGATFDKEYVYGQIVLHEKARALIDDQLTAAMVDPDLKSALAELRTSIEGHHLDAQKLHKALGSDGGTGGDSGTSSSGGVGPGWPDGGIRRDGGLELRDGGVGLRDSGVGLRDSGLQLPDPDDLLRDD